MNKTPIIFGITLVLLLVVSVVVAAPNGASTVNEESSSSAPTDAPGSDGALAGNVTEITLSGSSNSQSWQGYFGNVSGAIRLADGSGNVLYNWSLASPQGEVFASNSSSVTWSSIECFNLTQNGSALEALYNIPETAADGVNETFSTGNGHDAFTVGSTSFTTGECPSTQVFDSTGAGVDNSFEEVLLTDGTHTVFTSLLEEDLLGFDQRTHDFEMIVLEDGHNGDVATNTYYFYIELN